MATGFGVDETRNVDGEITSATSSLDVRNIWNALYSPGVISGGAVTTSASDMSYDVSAGVAVIKMTNTENVLAPIPAGKIFTATAGPVARTDIVYAKQNIPSVEGDSNVVLEVGTSLPARSVALGKRIINPNSLNTNAGVKTGNIDYSIPYGASLGVLHTHHFQYNGVLNHGITRYGAGTIYLPTDRRVRFSLTVGAISSQGAVGFDTSKYCEVGFLPSYDNGDMVLWSPPALHQAVQSLSFSETVVMSAGQHPVNYGVLRLRGPGNPYLTTGIINGFGRNGIIFTVEDLGPSL